MPRIAPSPNASRQPTSTEKSCGSRRTIDEQRADRRAEPPRAVDREVDPPAHARRDQLVDRGVDRRVLAADPGAGEEAEEEEAPGAPGERGRDRRDEVEAERDHEQLLAAPAVGQVAEDERAADGAGDVERADQADLERREVRAWPSGASARSSRRSSPRDRRGSRRTPSATTTSQCQRAQGSRSSRFGTSVSIVSGAALLMPDPPRRLSSANRENASPEAGTPRAPRR